MPTERSLPIDWYDDDDHIIGYLAGARAASYGVCTSNEQATCVAFTQYLRASRTFILDHNKFIAGWLAGYERFMTPIIIVCIMGGNER